jgi:hypothetical protein
MSGPASMPWSDFSKGFSVAVMVMMPFRARPYRRRLPVRSRVLLSGFLEPPLIAGRIHNARRGTARQGRHDAREFNGANEKNQRCG